MASAAFATSVGDDEQADPRRGKVAVGAIADLAVAWAVTAAPSDCLAQRKHRAFAQPRHCPVVGRAGQCRFRRRKPQPRPGHDVRVVRNTPGGESGRRITLFRRPPNRAATARLKRDRAATDRRSTSSRRSSSATGHVTGVEALARWDGADSPEELFARAAATGLSERLSRLIQRKALRTVGNWTGPLGRLAPVDQPARRGSDPARL